MRRFEGSPEVPTSRNPDQRVNHENRPGFQQSHPNIHNNQLTPVPKIIPDTKSLDPAGHAALYQKYYGNYPEPPQEPVNEAYTLYQKHFGKHPPPPYGVKPGASGSRNSKL